MKTITVNLDERSYPIYLGGSLADIGDTLKNKGLSGKMLVITNTTVGKFYGDVVMKSLVGAGFVPSITKIPDGEKYKTFETANNLYQVCVSEHLERKSLIVALGGGVVGDIAGFVAATFMRGVPFVNVPTTLLAQVDSSIGGKVGVNHSEAKNIIGAFYQPLLVYTDISTLKTLPEREFNSGFAEVIKYGIIMDEKYFTMIEENLPKIKALSSSHLEHIICRSCQLKKRIVELDEKEHGLRAILNFGHTIGHAIEAETNYKTYLHGEALSIGMVCASKIAKELKLLNKICVKKIEKVLIRVGLPVKHNLSADKIIKKMLFDKKVVDGKVRFVLPNGGLGKTIIKNDVPKEIIKKVLEEQKGVVV